MKDFGLITQLPPACFQAEDGRQRKRVKTVAGGDYLALLEAVADF